jgi:hypothetical protein
LLDTLAQNNKKIIEQTIKQINQIPHCTSEEHQRHPELIKQWKPWKKSTGPKTIKGKNKVKKNSWKHGIYSEEAKQEMREARVIFRLFNLLYPKPRRI